MLNLIMAAVIGLSDNTLVTWQTGKPVGYYCDVQVGAQSKHFEIGANSELWSVIDGRYGLPVYANYGLYGQVSFGPFVARVEHNCLHHVTSNKMDRKLPYIDMFYQQGETRATVGIKLKQKVW
jgi:hypothetical protein